MNCGSTVLASSDLLVACQCDQQLPPSSDYSTGGDNGRANEIGAGRALSHQEDDASGSRSGRGLTQVEAAAHDTSVDRTEGSSVCMYSIKPSNGKLQWEAEILRSPSSMIADGLPDGALSQGQQPVVLADSVLVLMRRSVVSVQRRPSLMPGPDGRKGGEVLWQLSLPSGSVATAGSRLELHEGLLFLITSPEPEPSKDREKGDNHSQREHFGNGTKSHSGRILLVINPSTGQVCVTTLIMMEPICILLKAAWCQF